MKYIFIKFVFASVIFSYPTFNAEDWYIINNLGVINSITEDYYSVHFASDNGIFSYDKATEDFYFNVFLSKGIESGSLRHFFYDINSDHYWLLQSNKISMKSSLSDFWREIYLSDIGIFSYYEIVDIGSSDEYIWFKTSTGFFAVNPISGIRVNEEFDYTIIDDIVWGYSKYGIAGKNLDINDYVFEDWFSDIEKFGEDKEAYFFNSKKGKIRPTVKMKDNIGNVWFGSDKSIILKGWEHSYRLEVVKFGLHSENISTIYFDENENWWFANNSFNSSKYFTSNPLFSYKNDFLTNWNEQLNIWNYYDSNGLESINMDVNEILKLDQFVYLCTMKGLLILDLYDNSLKMYDKGFFDIALWDVEVFRESLILATSKGINEFSVKSNSVLSSTYKIVDMLKGVEVYDLFISNEILYVASEIGLYSANLIENNVSMISNREFRKIEVVDKNCFALNNNLWKINLNETNEEMLYVNIDDFCLIEDFIWLNYNSYVELVDFKSNYNWRYSFENGIPGSHIFQIDCSDEWAWFSTNNGIAFYNWGLNHDK